MLPSLMPTGTMICVPGEIGHVNTLAVALAACAALAYKTSSKARDRTLPSTDIGMTRM
jgi:hypothetical protein